MEANLLDIRYRKKVIEEIKGDENQQRKINSYKKMNVQNDNFYQYVKEYLESKLDPETVKELHIFANVNLQRRVSKSEASIYKRQPTREFYNGSSEIKELKDIYNEMDVDTCLKRANEAFKYEDQCAIQIYPDNGNLSTRVLLPHHYDVIPDDKNPEMAMCYIISNFDSTTKQVVQRDPSRTGYSQGNVYSDNVNQTIADYDDSKLEKDRFYWWSKNYNFVTNGKGEFLAKESEEILREVEDNDINILSPLAEYNCLPFIDIATAKDFEFWVRPGNTLYDATIMYNTIITSEFQTVEMQGHAQPYYKGDAEHMPENVRIGVDKMIFIPINPNNPTNAEFGFANPGSDLAGIRDFRESFLAAFLSSRGLDTSVISGNSNVQKASSGVERMMQQIEKFEASQEDFSLFKKVEKKLAKVITAWIKSLYGVRDENGNLVLDEVYQVNLPDPMDVTLNIEFTKPELLKTDQEKIEIAKAQIEAGLLSRVHAAMDLFGLEQKQAEKYIKEVDTYEGLNGETEVFTEGSESEI
jgi:hypothetical protein